MQRVFFYLFMALAVATQLNAATYTVNGHVVGPEGEPEAYATVRIFTESDSVKAAALGVVGDEGDFSLQLKALGNYRLNITSVGKTSVNLDFNVAQPVTDLGTLVMNDALAELGEVEVTAMRPLVSKEIDRIGYDVANDQDAKTSTVSDILRKVPLVTVETDGTIKVKGSTDFKIYKNGKPNNALNSNSKDILAAIPASMIKKIEVITDPGAREDAEGVSAILNIVTIENTEINGIMGSISTHIITDNPPMGNVWLTGNIGKVNLSVNGGYFHQGRKFSDMTITQDFNYVESGNRLTSEAHNTGKADIGFWGLNGSYELDSLNLFTLEFSGFAYSAEGSGATSTAMYGPTGDKLYSYNTLAYSPFESSLSFNGNFNYQRLTRRKGEVITLLYQISNDHNKNESESTFDDLYNFPAAYSGINSNTKRNFLEQTVQLDWSRPIFGNSTLSVGAKMIHRNSHALGDNEYVGLGTDYSDFTHITTVGAAYADYRLNLGRWGARAGLRYEYSHLGANFNDGSQEDFGSDLNDWVPNASVMYNINDSNTLKFSYGTRIIRPSISNLDPTRSISPTSESYGNPNLNSVHNQTLELDYSLIKQKFNVNFNVTYAFSNNSINSYTVIDPDNNDFKTTTFGNIGKNRRLFFSLYGQFALGDKTTLNLNASANYRRIMLPGVENSRWGYDVFARASQKLPWKLLLEGMLFYNSQSLNDVYSFNDNDSRAIFYGFGLQRSFLNDKLTIQLMAQRPFGNNMVDRTRYNQGGYVGYSENINVHSTRFAIRASFRFGSVKSHVKRTQTSISNDDVEGTKAPSTGMSM